MHKNIKIQLGDRKCTQNMKYGWKPRKKIWKNRNPAQVPHKIDLINQILPLYRSESAYISLKPAGIMYVSACQLYVLNILSWTSMNNMKVFSICLFTNTTSASAALGSWKAGEKWSLWDGNKAQIILHIIEEFYIFQCVLFALYFMVFFFFSFFQLNKFWSIWVWVHYPSAFWNSNLFQFDLRSLCCPFVQICSYLSQTKQSSKSVTLLC